MKRLIFYLAILTWLPVTGQIDKGNHYYKIGFYRDAIPCYEEHLKAHPEDTKTLFHLGVSYLQSLSIEKGSEYIKKAHQQNSNVDDDIEFWLGRASHLNYEFEEAIRHYTTYVEALGKSNPKRVATEKLITEVNNAKIFVASPSGYRITNLGSTINSDYSDHSPVLTQDGSMIFYTSRRFDPKLSQENQGKDKDGQYLEHIYFSFKDDQGNWSAPHLLEVGIEGHNSIIQLFDNDNKMVIYKDNNEGDVFICEEVNGEWSQFKSFAKISEVFSIEPDIFIHPDGNSIYIASNQQRQNPNYDLWWSKRNSDGTWTEPDKIPGAINTPYEENAPYVSADGKTLFFSSTGHNSMGGYDIFRSEWDSITNTWGEPVNLGYPINSPSDEIYFYYTNKEKWGGTFASYRQGGYGEKDLYEVTFVPNIILNGIIADQSTDEGIHNIEAVFVSESDHKIIDKGISQPGAGKFKVNLLADEMYNVILIRDGDTIGMETYHSPKIKEGDPIAYEYKVNIDPSGKFIPTNPVKEITTEPIATNTSSGNEKEKQTAKSEAEKYFGFTDVKEGTKGVMRNVYFEFNDAILKPISDKELNILVALLKQYPDLDIVVSGHTDAVGAAGYNKWLSLQRANSVAEYLIRNGINKYRIQTIGYGEEVPLASNDDEEEGRELNRRTEFEMIRKKPILSLK